MGKCTEASMEELSSQVTDVWLSYEVPQWPRDNQQPREPLQPAEEDVPAMVWHIISTEQEILGTRVLSDGVELQPV